jgi:hypothetical protein
VSPSSPSEPISYAADIKPLFRERDRNSMLSHFDLWSYGDVSDHAPAILARLSRARCHATVPGPPIESSSSEAGSRREPLHSRDRNDAGHGRGPGSPAEARWPVPSG